MEVVWKYKIINDLIGIFMPIYFANRVMPTNKKNRYILYSFIMVILYLFLLVLSIKYPFIRDFNTILLIIPLLYPIGIRSESLAKKIFGIAFYISSIATILVLGLGLMVILYKIGVVSSVEKISMNNFTLIVIIRVVQLIYIHMVSKNISFIRFINDKVLLMLSIIGIGNYILANLVIKHTFYYSYLSNELMIIISAGLFFVQIVNLYMLNLVSNIIEEKMGLEIILKSKQNDEDIMRMHKEVRGWRHDMRNHINIVLGLLERNSSDEAIKYINEIDKRTREFEEMTYTENIALDSILSSKVKLAEEKGIKVQLDLNVLSDIKLSKVDICTVFGNLLDNSIEACEKIKEGKFITLKILGQEDKLIIRIKNNTDGDLREEKGIFKTTKTGMGHGIGLAQIDRVVKKHDGYIKRTHENNVFDTSIMINY